MPDFLPTDPAPPSFDSLPDTGSTSSPGAYVEALRRVNTRLEAIERAEERRAGAAKTLSVIWGIFGATISAGALALGTWVWTVQGDVSELVHATGRNAERLQEHAARGGPLGHPDSVLARTATNEGRIAALETSADRIEARLGEVDDKVDEILERIPRRVRR